MPQFEQHHSASCHSGGRLDSIRQAVAHAAHLLPAQGPITVFIHHNTLHAFEDRPFHEAVVKGAATFGCQPYLPEDQYRELVRTGRITSNDLAHVLLDDLGDRADELLGFLGTRFHLRLAMLEYTWHVASSSELRWFIAEADSLNQFWREGGSLRRDAFISRTRQWVTREWMARDGHDGSSRVAQNLADLIDRFGASSMAQWSEDTWQAFAMQLLWRICRQGAHGRRPPEGEPRPARRHRELLSRVTGRDSDELVNELLIRFCSVYLDQGFADWQLPGRELGFFHSFLQLYASEPSGVAAWRRELPALCRDLLDRSTGPLEAIDSCIAELGVGEREIDDYLASHLLALRGWAGMISQIETRSDRAIQPIPRDSLLGYVAVRLLLEMVAVRWLAKDTLGYRGSLTELPHVLRSHLPTPRDEYVDQLSFQMFQLAQYRGWSPSEMACLSRFEWNLLTSELEAFSEVERRRIFHLAYERNYRQRVLDALSVHADHHGRAPSRLVPSAGGMSGDAGPAAFQVVTCIDEREESLRRHLEEVAPECETFSAAGFFSVAMYYRGAAEAHFVPLCPISIIPQHYVEERVAAAHAETSARRRRTRRVLGTASRSLHRATRALFGGALTASLGTLATIPLVARILFPRLTAQLRSRFGRFVQIPPVTHLVIERSTDPPGPGLHSLGYSIAEMASIVERLLRDIGLPRAFSRLVLMVGHGSSSLNNPHESAHDCGACGGGRGGPNARAFAAMANDRRVRELLAANGMTIPDGTIFVGAYHNTCDDSVTFYDVGLVPESHAELLEHAKLAFDRARRWDAHERCRRFESAPTELEPEEALRHVEGRAEDLAQVRPEYGHATNAFCVVGRRRRTRGLYLDRRAFLASYDPTQDDAEQTILTRILQAVVPVCAGISLEYYFSFVDPYGYGCATKLPHNITSLLGVMDGAASDLRPGLPWQMVEIHEPMRQLFVIESTPDALQRILDRNPEIAQLCHGGWVQVATLDPDSSRIHLLSKGRFEPHVPTTSDLPRVASSQEWYRGQREHLDCAEIASSRAEMFRW